MAYGSALVPIKPTTPPENVCYQILSYANVVVDKTSRDIRKIRIKFGEVIELIDLPELPFCDTVKQQVVYLERYYRQLVYCKKQVDSLKQSRYCIGVLAKKVRELKLVLHPDKGWVEDAKFQIPVGRWQTKSLTDENQKKVFRKSAAKFYNKYKGCEGFFKVISELSP